MEDIILTEEHLLELGFTRAQEYFDLGKVRLKKVSAGYQQMWGEYEMGEVLKTVERLQSVYSAFTGNKLAVIH